MIKAVIKTEVLKKVFRALDNLVSEARFEFKKDGVQVKAVDSANVAMVIVNVPANVFESYEYLHSTNESTEHEETVCVGIDISNIYRNFLKSSPGIEDIEIFLGDINIELASDRYRYSISLIDPEAIRKPPKPPDLPLPAEVSLDAKEFKKAIQMCGKISDEVVFSTNEDNFTIESVGDVDRCSISFSGHNGAEARSIFSIEYMKEISNIGDKGSLTIKLGTDLPGRFSFDFGGYTIEYIVAPRIHH